ncbi:MAG: 4Fe-4S dicluster domain-containing protein [Dehalococcoidales bacterium]|nr:4Fe-4S dicluster domain-containing protein [Dehalococcoidales bacterium]
MAQHGFFFDQSRCSGCRACSVACKSWHNLPPGPLKYLRIFEYEKGSFPDVRIHFQWVPCYHCEKPECIGACPNDAIHKEEKYGAILIDSEKCDGCRLCYDACPYGAPVFASDDAGVKAQKCDMCMDRLESGEQPICVMACPNRALDFGVMSDLAKRYGDKRDIEDMPDSQKTRPAVIFKAHSPKKQLVPYNSRRALEVMMRRDPLPPIFDKIEDVTDIPKGMVGRSKLVIKPQNADELMRYTRCDEG